MVSLRQRKKVEITFNGCDGKSYDGESRIMNVLVCPTHPGKKFVYKRQGGFTSIQCGIYKIDAMFEMIVNKATCTAHPEVEYFWSEDVPYVEA